MNAISLLKREHLEYKRALEKSRELYAIGKIDKQLHKIHVENLTFLIEEFTKAINILEKAYSQ